MKRAGPEISETRTCPHGKRFDDACYRCERGIERIKACPFCGDPGAKLFRDAVAYNPPFNNVVICICGACGPNASSEENAVGGWNRRKQPRTD